MTYPCWHVSGVETVNDTTQRRVPGVVDFLSTDVKRHLKGRQGSVDAEDMKRRRDTGHFFESWATAGDEPAVTGDGHTISHAELDRRIENRRAELGAARRLLLIESASEIEPLVTYLAALRGRHPVMMVAPGPAIDGIVETYEPDSVFRETTNGWRLEHLVDEPADDLHPDLAVLLSTSGSTGVSKFVRLSRSNLAANAESIADYLDIRSDDTALLPLPLHYCYGLSVVHSHLLRGASIVMTDRSVVDPCFWDLVAEHEVTTFPAVPFTFDLLDRVDFAAKDVPSLRYITQAGGKLAPETVRRYAELGQAKGFDLYVMYGATEATARMAYLPPELAIEHPEAIGQPIPGGSFDLAEDGELLYAGPNVMMGYATTRADLAKGPEHDVLHTGDLARRNDAGLFEIVGRKSRFLKMFGLRISLDGVEAFAAELVGDASMCAATGTDDLLVVALVGCAADEADIARRRIADRFGLPLASLRITTPPELPRLANDKIDYVNIRGSVAAASASSDRISDETAGSPAELFARLLGLSDVSPDETFVTLGGDSLSYVEASIELESMLGHVPPLWHLMTVAELGASRKKRGRLRSVETGVAIRALAILAVMASHFEVVNVVGGAHVLLAAAGFNFSRFTLNAMSGKESAAPMVPVLARIMVPTTAWVLAVFVLSRSFEPSILVYLSHLTTDAGGGYWFIEILIQILVVAALAFSVPKLRAAHRISPYLFAVAALTLALYLRFGLDAVWNTEHLGFKVFHMSFWLFAIGWVAEQSRFFWQRLALSALVLVTVPGFFDSISRTLVIIGGVLALIWIPTVRVPAPLNRVLGAIGGASLYLYLVHFQVNTVLGIDQPAIKLGVALVAGLIAAAVWSRIFRWSSRTAMSDA